MTTTINASTSSGLINTADTSGILQLQTAGTAAVTIDASQNVGIGTTSPSYKVVSAVARGSTAFALYNTNAGSYDGWLASTSDNGLAINARGQTAGNASGNTLYLQTGDTTRAVIDSSGNVGIGTSSPASYSIGTGYQNLVMNGTNGSGITFLGAGTTNLGTIFGQNSDLSTWVGTNGSGPLKLYTNNTERMRIDSSGNVGIGTTSPSAILHTKTAGGEGMRIQGTATSAFLRYTDATNTSTAYIGQDTTFSIINQANTDMRFATNNTERMRIDSSGKLLLGTTGITAGYSNPNVLVIGGVTSPTLKLQSTTGPHAWDIYCTIGTALYFSYDQSDKGYINQSTGVYTALSDVNKKKDFEASTVGLAEVLQLQPKLFRMLEDADDAPKELGFIAQEVQPYIPQAYVESKNENGTFIGLQDRPIIAALTKAIQELKQIVDAQAAEIAALKTKVGG